MISEEGGISVIVESVVPFNTSFGYLLIYILYLGRHAFMGHYWSVQDFQWMIADNDFMMEYVRLELSDWLSQRQPYFRGFDLKSGIFWLAVFSSAIYNSTSSQHSLLCVSHPPVDIHLEQFKTLVELWKMNTRDHPEIGVKVRHKRVMTEARKRQNRIAARIYREYQMELVLLGFSDAFNRSKEECKSWGEEIKTSQPRNYIEKKTCL